MVVVTLLSSAVGGECASDVKTPTTLGTQTGAGAGLPFVIDGESSRIFLLTWGKNPHPLTQLTALTMTATMNLAIADGSHPKNSSETAVATRRKATDD